MAYGLTSTGFVPKPYEQVLADVQADLRSRFGESIDLSASSVFGQLAGIIAERVSEVWDAAQGVYNAFVPDASTGSAPPATRSTCAKGCRPRSCSIRRCRSSTRTTTCGRVQGQTALRATIS